MKKKNARDEFIESVRAASTFLPPIIRPPYIMAAVEFRQADGLPFTGYGFSKQNRYGKTADRWNEGTGIKIAQGRALSDMIRQIEEDGLRTEEKAKARAEEHAP